MSLTEKQKQDVLKQINNMIIEVQEKLDNSDYTKAMAQIEGKANYVTFELWNGAAAYGVSETEIYNVGPSSSPSGRNKYINYNITLSDLMLEYIDYAMSNITEEPTKEQYETLEDQYNYYKSHTYSFNRYEEKYLYDSRLIELLEKKKEQIEND